jgi:hypothetical protein
MGMSQSELRAVVERSIPVGFVDATLLAYLQANNAAHQECAKYAPAERDDVFGHVQRAHMQGKWRESVSMLAGVRATTRKNKKKTQSYSCVSVGQLVMTESAVQFPRLTLPREAHFRNVLAEAQIDIWDDSSTLPDAVYCIFTHATNRRHEPVFASLVVPGRRLREPLLSIGLELRLARLAEELREKEARRHAETSSNVPEVIVAPVATIQEPPTPVIRETAKKKNTPEENAG